MKNTEGRIVKRNSSIECLRIVSMFLIELCHISTHSGLIFSANIINIPRLWFNFISIWGNVGTSVFVLISGYYLVERNQFHIDYKRILKLGGEILFYSISIWAALCVFNVIKVTPVSLIKAVFPLTYSKWWFASTYFVLYLLHPYLNIFLKSVSQECLKKMLALLIFFWSIIPTFSGSSYQSNNLLWFVTLYCIAAYLRKYVSKPRTSQRQLIKYIFFLVVFLYFTSLIIMILETKIPVLENIIVFFYGRQSIFVLGIAVMIFVLFNRLNLGYHRWINIIASTTFGVYLIHDNPDMRTFLWTTVFKVADYQSYNEIILYIIWIAFVVFFSCTAIDLARQKTIEKLFLKTVDSILKRKKSIYENQ